MAELKYDKKTGRLLFTKQMKKEYTILMPNMAPIHLKYLKRCSTTTAISLICSTQQVRRLRRQVLNMFTTIPVIRLCWL